MFVIQQLKQTNWQKMIVPQQPMLTD